MGGGGGGWQHGLTRAHPVYFTAYSRKLVLRYHLMQSLQHCSADGVEGVRIS